MSTTKAASRTTRTEGTRFGRKLNTLYTAFIIVMNEGMYKRWKSA